MDILMETDNVLAGTAIGNNSDTRRFVGDISQSSHYTFAMGDLNYRSRLANVEIGSERHIKLCHSMARKQDWPTLNKYDELRGSLEERTCLVGFDTPFCNFPPTFKVARHDGYHYNVKRSPSYTDRILYKKADQLDYGLQMLLYEPVESFKSSDHKPIRSGFSIRLNKELKWKPLSYGVEAVLPISQTASILEQQSNAREEECKYDPNKILFMYENENTDNLNQLSEHKTQIFDDPFSSQTTKVEQETMHFFVTDISCTINPKTVRKQTTFGSFCVCYCRCIALHF